LRLSRRDTIIQGPIHVSRSETLAVDQLNISGFWFFNDVKMSTEESREREKERIN
jgi:hypothetical protein